MWVFQGSYTLTTTWYFSHFSEHVVVFHSGFNFHFLVTKLLFFSHRKVWWGIEMGSCTYVLQHYGQVTSALYAWFPHVQMMADNSTNLTGWLLRIKCVKYVKYNNIWGLVNVWWILAGCFVVVIVIILFAQKGVEYFCYEVTKII